MTVTCPTCNASLTIPDDRLPMGKAVTAACPQCKGKIVIDLTGPASSPEAAASPAPAAEAPATYGEKGQPLALVCVDAPAEREQVMAVLKGEGYAPRAATSAADAVQRLRFMAYALVVVREGYGSTTGDGSPVLDSLAEMGTATRRLTHVVLVSPGLPSHDASAAFARSVNLVLHVNDLPHLGEALKRSRAETEQTYRVLLESLRAQGKG